MLDVHCHIVPDVDDGSRSLDESRAMLAAAARVGIDSIICTPHCKHHDFSYRRVRSHYETLYPYAQQMGIEMRLGFEVHWRMLSDLGLENLHYLTTEGTNSLLIEFSYDAFPTNWQRVLYDIQGDGLDIIIAHPERYRPIQEDLAVARELRDMGCLLQLSGNFIAGGFFDRRRVAAQKLLKARMVDFIASDAHRVDHYDLFAQAMDKARTIK